MPEKFVCSKYNSYVGYKTFSFSGMTTSSCSSELGKMKSMVHFPSLTASFNGKPGILSMHSHLVYSIIGPNVRKIANAQLKKQKQGLIVDYINLDVDSCLQDKIQTSQIDNSVADYSELQKYLTSILVEVKTKYKSSRNMTLIPADDGLYVGLMETVGEQNREIISTFAVNGI